MRWELSKPIRTARALEPNSFENALAGIERKRKAAEKAKKKAADKAMKERKTDQEAEQESHDGEEWWDEDEWTYGCNSGFGDEGIGS